MTDLDAPEDRALTAANAINRQVGRLWLSAHTEGVRNGLATAALLADQFADNFRDNYDLDAEIRAIGPVILAGFRDQLHLVAMQWPEPELPESESE
ncbi:hypothetical protein SEA_BOBBY_109 [Mycobacterium phage Bobby]|nr:hypothetical protein SEA_BOBBY_109 [Mycobacterium phage Bobby]